MTSLPLERAHQIKLKKQKRTCTLANRRKSNSATCTVVLVQVLVAGRPVVRSHSTSRCTVSFSLKKKMVAGVGLWPQRFLVPFPLVPLPQPSKDPRGVFTRPRGGTRVAVEALTLSSLYRVHPLCQAARAVRPRCLTSESCLLLAICKLDDTHSRRAWTDYLCG